MLSDSFIRSPLVGAAAPVAFKTAVPFLCTAVGKQICSLDSPLLEAAPTRCFGFKLSIFRLCVNLKHTFHPVLFLQRRLYLRQAAPTLIHPDGNNVLADHYHK